MLSVEDVWLRALIVDAARTFTNQVWSTTAVRKAIVNGDLTEKIEVDLRGEILELETVNGSGMFICAQL